MLTFAQYLKKNRISEYQAASELGWDQSKVNRVKNGKIKASLSDAFDIKNYTDGQVLPESLMRPTRKPARRS